MFPRHAQRIPRTGCRGTVAGAAVRRGTRDRSAALPRYGTAAPGGGQIQSRRLKTANSVRLTPSIDTSANG